MIHNSELNEEDTAKGCALCSKGIKNVSVEVVLFLHNIASMMVYMTAQDLMLNKSCRVNHGYSDEICNNLTQNNDEEVEVQKLLSNFLLWQSYLETSIKIIAVPLLGWWGDRKGRKYPMIFCLFFLGMSSFSYFLNSWFENLPLEATLSSAFIYGISGGTHSVLMLTFAYMADHTTVQRRTIRFGFLDGFWYLGSPIGAAISSPILKTGGYISVFGLGAIIYVISIIYVSIVIKQPQKENFSEGERSSCCTECGFDKISNSFYTTFKKRPNNDRKHIIILLIAMLFDAYVIWGESNVKYLCAQRALNWNYAQYSQWSSTSQFLTFFGAFIVVPVLTMKYFVHDCMIGLVGALSRTFTKLIYSLAVNPSLSWLMYFGAVIGTCAPLAPIAIRAQLSKLAAEDVGQAFAVMAVGESFLPFLAAPVYNNLYEASVEIYPSSFYLVSTFSNICLAFCFIYVYISLNRSNKSDEEVD